MSGTMIHIFNPETDFALAAGNNIYTPPAAIVKFRKEMALFPAKYASDGDLILTLDEFSSEDLERCIGFDYALKKGIRIITPPGISSISGNLDSCSQVSILPWGWNHSILKFLKQNGVPDSFLKSENDIRHIRQLAHRRTVIPFQKRLSEKLPHVRIDIAREFTNSDDAIEFMHDNPAVYFKSPWSSSGRGVVKSDSMSEGKIEDWIRGCIRRQGSVMGEIGKDRAGDFATEWWCADGKVKYLGLSVFNTSPGGRYAGNLLLPQESLEKKIGAMTKYWGREIIEAQCDVLSEIVSPFYEGPAGIDMFATVSGELNPCVEINLRMTMGLASLWISNSH